MEADEVAMDQHMSVTASALAAATQEWSLPEKATRVLRDAVARLKAHPDRYDQNVYCRRTRRFLRLQPICESEMCLAGEIVLTNCPVASENGHGEVTLTDGGRWKWDELAERVLGIDLPEDHSLFGYSFDWPHAFATEYRNATSAEGRVAVLGHRVEHFIATGE